MRSTVLVTFSLLSLACDDRRLTTIRATDADAGTAGSGAAGTSGAPPGPCGASALVGFASVGTTIGGGESGMTIRVATPEQLAENTSVAEPRVIEIVGMLDVPSQVPVASNKTILGVGRMSGINGGGLNVIDARNVIIRNLVIMKPRGQIDAIQIYNSDHVWIDHCDLSSELNPSGGTEYYDGLVDIVHGSDDVTVSWTRFHDHNHVSLIGNEKDTPEEDMGRLNVTFHHNSFTRTQAYNPLVRFGSVHVFNNVYSEVTDVAIAARLGARVLVEANTFDKVPTPFKTEDTASITDRASNVYVDSPTKTYTQGADWTPPYDYTSAISTADEARILVGKCAGTQP